MYKFSDPRSSLKATQDFNKNIHMCLWRLGDHMNAGEG